MGEKRRERERKKITGKKGVVEMIEKEKTNNKWGSGERQEELIERANKPKKV